MSKHMDHKRTALICAVMSAALVFGAAVFLRGRTTTTWVSGPETEVALDRSQVLPQETTTAWANCLPGVRKSLLEIDGLIESPPANVDPAAEIAGVMATPHPQLRELKLFVALAIVDRQRARLLPALLSSLAPTATPDDTIRIQLAVSLRKYIVLHGTSDFTAAVTKGLLQLHASAGNSPSTFQRILGSVLTDLGVAHQPR